MCKKQTQFSNVCQTKYLRSLLTTLISCFPFFIIYSLPLCFFLYFFCECWAYTHCKGKEAHFLMLLSSLMLRVLFFLFLLFLLHNLFSVNRTTFLTWFLINFFLGSFLVCIQIFMLFFLLFISFYFFLIFTLFFPEQKKNIAMYIFHDENRMFCIDNHPKKNVQNEMFDQSTKKKYTQQLNWKEWVKQIFAGEKSVP